MQHFRITVSLMALLLTVSCSSSTNDQPTDGSASDSQVAPGGPPDQWIAYQWLASGDTDGIYLVRPDGSGNTRILQDLPGSQIHPDWSPDGTQLAFILQEGDTQDVWVANADGSDAELVAPCTDPCLGYDFVAWSPSGEQLLIASFNGPPDEATFVPASSSLVLLDLASGTVREIYSSAYPRLLNEPRWSPDGNSYCMTVETSDQAGGPLGSEIVIGTIDGAEPRTVTDPAQFGAYCDWSSRDLIVFTTYNLVVFQSTNNASELYTIRPDGTDLQQLTSFGAGQDRATQPRWTPDGERILFTKVSGSGPRSMASVSADGSDEVWATGENAENGTHPTLQPRP